MFNKLPANLRCKALTITFRVPENVIRVFFKDQNTEHEMQWKDVKNVKTLGTYISENYSWVTNPSSAAA